LTKISLTNTIAFKMGRTILFAQHFQILRLMSFLCHFTADLYSTFIHRQFIKITIKRIWSWWFCFYLFYVANHSTWIWIWGNSTNCFRPLFL